jgi:hypothetical protein
MPLIFPIVGTFFSYLYLINKAYEKNCQNFWHLKFETKSFDCNFRWVTRTNLIFWEFNPLLYRLSYLAIWNFTTKTVKKRNYSKNRWF